MAIEILVNGLRTEFDGDPQTPLIYVLRNELKLNGPKFGCGLGQCGACAVLVDGIATRSCIMPVAGLKGRAVTTLEGLGTPEKPHPLQRAFINEQAVQCGYCSNGLIIAAADLLARDPKPSESAIRGALAGHLCRCGSHVRVIRAVKSAAEQGA